MRWLYVRERGVGFSIGMNWCSKEINGETGLGGKHSRTISGLAIGGLLYSYFHDSHKSHMLVPRRKPFRSSRYLNRCFLIPVTLKMYFRRTRNIHSWHTFPVNLSVYNPYCPLCVHVQRYKTRVEARFVLPNPSASEARDVYLGRQRCRRRA